MVVAVKGQTKSSFAVVLSMFWWNSGGNGQRGIVRSSGGLWGTYAPSNVGIAVAVTAMAGFALAATLVYSSRRGSLKSPWSRRRRKNALSPHQWKTLFTPEGKLCDGGVKFLKKARSGGVDPSIRAEVWPFLLGVYDLNSTEEERDSIRNEKRKEYMNLRSQCELLLTQGDENIKLSNNGRTYSNGDNKSVTEALDSPSGSDASGGDSSCVDQGSPKWEGRDLKVHDGDPHTPNTFLEEDESHSGVTDLDNSPVAMGPSNSDSVGECQTMETSPVIEESEGSENNKPSKEDSSEGSENNKPSKEDSSETESRPKVCTTEDYVTWQRIIRLDAVRTNAEWVVYSPAQAAVTEGKARHWAEAVGLKDYDHLEPCRIYHAARLVAVLEAYALYDPEIGYCQGMSDLLSPIIAIIEEDYMAFWCFVGFMKKARHNFRLDEVGIRRQLSTVAKIIKCKDAHLFRHLQQLQAEDCFFVYRMVVVLFRRELTFEQTVCLWEVMWADQAAIRAGIGKSAWGSIRLKAPPTDDLLLYAIAASVLQRRKLIIEKYSGMDEIIRECNSMAGHLDVWKLLDDAHDLIVSLHDKI